MGRSIADQLQVMLRQNSNVLLALLLTSLSLLSSIPLFSFRFVICSAIRSFIHQYFSPAGSGAEKIQSF